MSEEKIIINGEEYFRQRMPEYNVHDVSAAVNQVELWRSVENENKLQPLPIFEPCEKGISIRLYDLDRHQITYKGENSRWSKDYKIIRLHTPRTDGKGGTHKYHIPKGAGTYPFLPPQILDKYEKKVKIPVLVLTEGAFKTFLAAQYGIDIIGLNSITHYKDPKTGGLHNDILRVIKQCSVEAVIWLADADANRISLKAFEAGDDIYKRPNQFFSSASSIQRMLNDMDVRKLFAYINPDIEGNPKGLDDLLIQEKSRVQEIVSDLKDISRSSVWFWREDMTYSVSKIRYHFCLHDINQFIEFHSAKIPDLKKKEFVWNGTKYAWDDEKAQAKMIVPADAGRFFRVGDHYHEKIGIPNKYGEIEHTFHRRMKQTIIDDYGKDILRHIPKYKAFCNVPNHVNYQAVHHGCYNMYFPFEHVAEEGDITYTMSFLKHIFGNRTITADHKSKGKITVNELDLGMDYLQLLYQQPQQILPILCLVSRENGTGKTTFAKWLKHLFGMNVAVVGNAELANDFNAPWAGKLIVVCDEAKIDKQVVVEKVKSLSTADKIFMNAKGKDHVELDFFAKFLFLTNNEENFIYAGEDDVRYWIRKIPVVQELFVDLLEEMISEIPAFIDYIGKRKMATEKLHRAWFYPELIKTEALKKVIAFSKSTVEKELRNHLRDMFLEHGLSHIHMTLDDIRETFFRGRYERNYLRKVIEEDLKCETYHEFIYNGGTQCKTMEDVMAYAGESYDPKLLKKQPKTKRYNFPKWERFVKDSKPVVERVYVQGNGRPYIFPVDKFLTREEIESRWIDPQAQFEAQIYAEDGQDASMVPVSTKGGGDELPF